MTVILIVEDDAVTRRLLAHTLGKIGYHTITVGSAQEGLDVLQQQTIDLMICDIQMPKVSGIELLRQVRADARHTELPVIMLTASGESMYRKEALAAGADVFLTKPTSSHQLRKTVNRLLN